MSARILLSLQVRWLGVLLYLPIVRGTQIYQKFPAEHSNSIMPVYKSSCTKATEVNRVAQSKYKGFFWALFPTGKFNRFVYI